MIKKIYLLYSDLKETELWALASNLEQRKEITKEYTSGKWFSYECDKNNDHIFYEDTKKKVRCKFPNEIKIKEELIKEDAVSRWLKNPGEIR